MAKKDRQNQDESPGESETVAGGRDPPYRRPERHILVIRVCCGPLGITDDRLAILELLGDRYNKAGTIITGQVPIGAWHEIIGEPNIADAVMDSLAYTPWIFELKGGSRRRKDFSD